ncbi:hypothetical protein [Streptomyces cavernicola]|uniref:DUF304 domain-containing protein n=1 Tax=Streptomyces cavernicola TaxID=3043613 RepID=A0ABT6SB78_9ACTN|nr:hypothetical protein [Streptomyces sp. B-S-A6]MDI3405456.1 hypothetical protein [Streptomyces sp. B-S-A6]
MTEPAQAPEVDRVLKRNKGVMTRHVITRLLLGAVLVAAPSVLGSLGAPNHVLTVLPIVPGIYVLLFLLLRVRHGRRLALCERVLRNYPLEYRTRVEKRGSEWRLLGTVYTVKLSTRGQSGAREMRAVNASVVRRWPAGAENGGAWFAGDPAFGGVMVVPGTDDMLFLQPAEWEKYESERAAADPARRDLAERAGISGLVEKEPSTLSAIGG